MHAEQLLLAWLSGDTSAEMGLRDYLEEHDMTGWPYKVGEKYLICLNTLYYVGKVKEVGFGAVILEGASWVHWTGRLSTLLAKGFGDKGWPSGHQRPRTEYVGTAIVHVFTNGAAAYPWPHELPVESVQS